MPLHLHILRIKLFGSSGFRMTYTELNFSPKNMQNKAEISVIISNIFLLL